MHARTHARTHAHTHTHTHPFNSPFSGTTQVSRYQKGKPIWILLEQETVSGSSLSWAICKSAPSSRHTTMPAPHNSVTFQSIKFQNYQTLQPHMTAYSSARMYSLICVIISNKWDLHSLSYLQGHSRLCVMWYPITSYKSSILTMPLSCTVSGILSYKQIIWAILHRTVDANIK